MERRQKVSVASGSRCVWLLCAIAGAGLIMPTWQSASVGQQIPVPLLKKECIYSNADWEGGGNGHSVIKGPPSVSPRLPGSSGVPTISWEGGGGNVAGTAGPIVHASVNGTGGSNSVFLGNGAAFVSQTDFHLPLNGIGWFHERKSSQDVTTNGWQGEGWWANEMMSLTVAGAEGASNCTVKLDPNYTLKFAYSGGSWTCDDNYLYTLTFSAGNDEYTMARPNGFKWIFHDSQATHAGKLKRIEDPYGNDRAFTYDGSSKLTYIVVDVVAGTDHKITYSYFTSGDNNGLLQYIKVYKSTTTTDANLIGKVEYIYHSSTADDYGSENDLMKVIVSRKATNDGDGTLSISETYYYRYYKGTYNADTNPGTDHHLKYVLLPENADRLNSDQGDPLTQTNADFEDYANIYYKYDSNSRVTETQERLAGSSCGCRRSWWDTSYHHLHLVDKRFWRRPGHLEGPLCG